MEGIDAEPCSRRTSQALSVRVRWNDAEGELHATKRAMVMARLNPK
jgi:hypothetical protein